MKNPLVSVIIPSYNYGKFIGDALKSAFDQTVQDFEIIVVDDGSTDNTKEIAESFGDKIRYFYQNRQGPARARNKAISESRGEYVAFLDADDIWLPTKSEKQIALFKSNPKLGMVVTDNYLFDEKGVYKDYVNKKGYLLTGDVVYNIFINSGVVTPTVMVRREVFDKVGLFEENLQIAEDDNMWIRIAAEYDVGIVDESLAKIRDHRGRTMRVSDKLADSLQLNIELLTTKYGSKLAERIKPLANLKYYQAYFVQGYSNFEQGNNRQARVFFKKALKINPGHRKTMMLLFATYAPRWAYPCLRYIKRIFSRKKTSSVMWFRQE